MPKALLPALAVAAAALASAAPASAADLGAGFEDDARPRGFSDLGSAPGRPAFEPRGRAVERPAEFDDCRIVVRRRVNEFGEEIIRRARICEEQPVVYRRPRPPLQHHDGIDHLPGSGELVPPADIPDEESALR